jgi:tetratricopeptide (TPR) repeat protein
VRLGRLAPLVFVWVCLAGGPAATPAIRVVDLLDQYVSGQFDNALAQLSERTDFDDLLKQLQRDGETWINARGAAEQPRRQLAAATFALEAARLDEWHEWKWIQRGEPRTLTVLSWKPAPLLIEWACARFRQENTPPEVERWWQLAALAVAQRSEDPQFLVGDLNAGLGAATGEIGNTTEEIRHLDHVAARFPQEARFMLAQGIAREWASDVAVRAKALAAFQALKNDVDVAGEATMRSGALMMRNGQVQNSIAVFDSVERMTRDQYVIYLARYLKGQANEQLRRPADAETAYRGGAMTIPGAQAATLSLAAMLSARDQPGEARRFAATALNPGAMTGDPWREYAHADDRFWPQLISRLRVEIHREAAAVPVADDSSPAVPARPARKDTVAVDVSVRAGNTPVTGLSAADFVLLDNGVRQRIDSVETTPIPLDVTLMLDLSGDQRGMRADPVSPIALANEINNSVRQVTQLLRPDDHLRVLGIDSSIRQIVPLQPVSSVKPVVEVSAGGLSSLYDGLVAALLQPVEPTRRHLVVVTSKGNDTISATSAEAVRAIAGATDARLHVVMLEREADNQDSRFRLQCTGVVPEGAAEVPPDSTVGLCWPTRRFWVPFDRRTMETIPGVDNTPVHRLLPTGRLLADASAVTDGRLHQGAGLTEQTPVSVLRAALDEFKQSYVLRYTPQGVIPAGWHALSVSVPRSSGATVRARPGYVLPAPDPAPRPLSTSLATYPDLVTLYSGSEYETVARLLRGWRDPEELIKRLDEDGNPWPATPRREAIFALELAEAGLFARRQESFEDAVALLKRFQNLVRDPLGPSAFERYWLWAGLTILQGKIRPNTAETFVLHALVRFPEEPRFLLARAIVTDQMFPFTGVMRSSAQTAAGAATVDHIARVIEQYTAAMKAPETATEARVRLAWFLFRVGRYDEALARLDEVRDDPSNDRALSYLHQLFRGHIQVALGRPAAGVDAFRRAIDRWPTAQSPYVGLMHALVQTGARAEAEAIAEHIQTAPADQTDPWFTYWLGDYRVYPAAIARLQEMIR